MGESIVQNEPNSSIVDFGPRSQPGMTTLRIGHHPAAGHPLRPTLALRTPNAQNEPNFGRCGHGEPPLFHYSIIPPFQCSADRAKRTQSGRAWAGPGLRGAKDAKRSQLGDSFRFEVSSVKQEKPMADSSNFTLHTSAGPLAGLFVQTNPIPAGRHPPPFYYVIVPPFQSDADCAKRSQFGDARLGSGESITQNKANPAGWPSVPNKPNFRQPKIPPFQSDGYRVKQTQFPAGPHGMGPGARETMGKCAKRTQFRKES